MIRGVLLFLKLQLILVYLINICMGIHYEFLVEDERIFSDCSDKPPGTPNVKSMFDLSNMQFAMDDDGISISGNHTLTWDVVQPLDRIELAASVRYFDRGTWQPTTLNMLSKDFCKVLFDHRQIWYDLYSKHVTNRRDIEENCTVKGTIYKMEPYKLDPRVGLGFPLKPGRYTVRLEFSAFDKSNVKRPNSICTEIKGEFFKA